MRRSSLAIVYLTVFVDLLGFGIILPLLPFYAERFGARGVWVGALLTAYSAVQFVSAPLLGRLSDRIGRRPVLLLSLAGSAISLTVTGFAGSLPLLLAARALAGLFGGSIATAQAYVADVTVPEQRARYMGILGAAVGLGFVCGPALGAGFSGLGFGTAAFIAAGIAAANLAGAWFLLPESKAAQLEATARGQVSPLRLLRAIRNPALTAILAATFLSTFAFVSMESTFALFGQRRFGLDSRTLGMIFAYVGIVMVAVQGGLVGRLNARFGERVLATAGAVIMSASLAALTIVPNLTGAFVVLTGLAAGQGLLSPALSALLSRRSGADRQGSTLGIGQSFTAGARAIGPILAGWLFDRYLGLPYILAAALVLLTAWLVARAAPAVAEAQPAESLPAAPREKAGVGS